jgi:hypothetical protein
MKSAETLCYMTLGMSTVQAKIDVKVKMEAGEMK